MVTCTTELLVGFIGVFGDIFETTEIAGIILGIRGLYLGVCLVLVGTFLVGIGLSFLVVGGTLFNTFTDKFNWHLVELTVGGTGECKKFAEFFSLVVSGGGLEREALERDPFGIVDLMAIDFAFALEGFTIASLEVVCLELVGVDMVVGFMLAGFDTLLGFTLLSFDTLVGFELKAFDMLVCFVPLGFETLMGIETVGFGLANIVFNGFGVTLLA